MKILNTETVYFKKGTKDSYFLSTLPASFGNCKPVDISDYKVPLADDQTPSFDPTKKEIPLF